MKRYLVEKDFEYRGLRCVTVFGNTGYRNGYVGIPEGNEYYGCDYSSVDIDCHGGLTYGSGGKNSTYPVKSHLWWLGLDCGHCWDGQDLELAMKEFTYMKRTLEIMSEFKTDLPVRSVEYVSQQCKKIVDQLLDSPAINI